MSKPIGSTCEWKQVSIFRCDITVPDCTDIHYSTLYPYGLLYCIVRISSWLAQAEETGSSAGSQAKSGKVRQQVRQSGSQAPS